MSENNHAKTNLKKELRKKDGIITTLTKKLAETTVVNRRLIIALTCLFLLTVGGSLGFGLHYFEVVNTLTGTEERLEEATSKLKTEEVFAAQQEALLLTANGEIETLKLEAAEQAAKDAEAELAAKIQAEKDSRKYIIAAKKESNLQGLNVRREPCGEKVSQYQVWGNAGEVLEGPVKPGPCLDGDYEWYKIKWNDGQEGWSIANYLEFSSSRLLDNTGVITGYVPFGYSYDEEEQIEPTVCAINQSDNISYCNSELNNKNFTYKLELPAGKYIVNGEYRFQDWESREIRTRQLRHTLLEDCGYTQECWETYRDNETAAIITVEPSGVLNGISLEVIYE